MLGRLPGGSKLGGRLALDVEAAERAVATVAEGLGIDIVAAAQAIIDIANENMHAALRVVSASSAATTRATSGSSPSAARGRCTPTRSPGSSAPTR